MMPISNYKELLQTLNWDEEKRNNERWYIFLVMNPRNQTNAGIDIRGLLIILGLLVFGLLGCRSPVRAIPSTRCKDMCFDSI